MATSRREALKSALVGAVVAALPAIAAGAPPGPGTRPMSSRAQERSVQLKDGSRLEITRNGNFLVKGGVRTRVDKGEFEMPGGDVMGVVFVESFNQFVQFPDDFIQGGGKQQLTPSNVGEQYEQHKLRKQPAPQVER